MKTACTFIHFSILIVIFLCLANSVENKKLQKSFEEIFGDGWHLKEMGEEGEEKEEEANLGEEKEEEANLGEEKEEEANLAQIMAQENDQQQKSDQEHCKMNRGRRVKIDEKLAIMKKYWETKRKDPKMSDRKIAEALKIDRGTIRKWKRKFRGSELFREIEMDVKSQVIVTDEQKRKIVREFLTIKERIKQQKRGKFSREQWNRMYNLFAKKLGTSREKIYKWMNELGMGQEMRIKERRMAIIRKYWTMKRNDPKMKDVEIAKALKVSGTSLTRWKTQFKKMEPIMGKVVVTDEQKRKIVREFRAIKEQIKQRKGEKYSREQWVEMDRLLAKKLGTNRDRIFKWIKEFGMSQKTIQTNEEKLAILRQYWAMKRNDPKMSDVKIAEALQIDRGSIRRWKAQFGEEGEEGGDEH